MNIASQTIHWCFLYHGEHNKIVLQTTKMSIILLIRLKFLTVQTKRIKLSWKIKLKSALIKMTQRVF